MKEIDEGMLSALRKTACADMSPKRRNHTLAVEQMVARLCALYCPEHTQQLRAAALLHDLTKELDLEGQLALCGRYGLEVTQEERLCVKTLHARTAAAKIEAEMPEFSHQIILSAVRWHTTGHRGMTLSEQLLYLADYIDESRTFENCVLLRQYFFSAEPDKMDWEKRLTHLHETLILSYNMTIRDLLAEGMPVASETVEARNELILLARRE